MGGFENKKAPFYFSRYCEYVVKNLGQGSEAPKFWITMNEPTVHAQMGYYLLRMGGLGRNWPPFKKNLFTFFKVVNRMATSHNISYQKIKSIRPDVFVGIATHNVNFESNRNPLNYLLVKFLIWLQNHRFLRKIEDRQDFIGLNYYFYNKFGDKKRYEKSDLGWNIYPKGIYNVLMELEQYHKPVFVTENGIADAGDAKRAKFIREHLYWVKRAIDDKIDVRGYFYWSLLDNYEWADGFEPKFGLVEVDFKTMERKIRPSAYEYKKVCESNSLI